MTCKKLFEKYLVPIIILIIIVCACILFFFPQGSGYTILTDPPEDMRSTSDTITQDTRNQLNTVAADLKNLADGLTGLTPDDPLAREQLYLLYEQYPNAAAVAWVDNKTDTTLTAPAFSLTEILSSPEISQICESSFSSDPLLLVGPVNSESLGMMPCFVVPVRGTDGSYTGFVLMPYAAALFQQNIAVPKNSRENLWTDVWVINSKGTLIYHPDTGTIGQNLYQGYFVTKHPELKDGLFYIIEHPAGSINYRAYDLAGTQVVEKTGVWQTISFGGQDLRVVTEQYPIPPQVYPYVEHAGPADQEEFVHKMYHYAKRVGMEKAVAEFNDPNGAFAGTGYDLFAYTMDGTELVSAKQVLLGANRLNYRDAYGIRPVNSMILRAEQGGGYVHYYRIVPYTENQAIHTSSYLRAVTEDWFVGASRVASAVPQTYTISQREAVTKTVRIIHGWVTDYGKETALSMIMDPAQNSVIGPARILAVTYNGTLLADTQYQDKIGEDIFYLTDRHGVSTIREGVMMAKQGGGYLYLEKSNPDGNTISLVYVEPMDGSWCVLSMIRLEKYNVTADLL